MIEEKDIFVYIDIRVALIWLHGRQVYCTSGWFSWMISHIPMAFDETCVDVSWTSLRIRSDLIFNRI